jgi:hypothetical protein
MDEFILEGKAELRLKKVDWMDTPEKLKDWIDIIMFLIIEYALRDATPDHVATGDLMASGGMDDLRSRQRGRTLKFEGSYKIRDPAGIILHTGSRPHCPPPYELYRWAVAKGKCAGEKECWSVAWKVHSAICERGNIAYGWLEDLYEKMREVFGAISSEE